MHFAPDTPLKDRPLLMHNPLDSDPNSDPAAGHLVPYGVRSSAHRLPHRPRLSWLQRHGGNLLTLVMFLVAIYALHRVMRTVHLADVRDAIAAISTTSLLTSLMFTAASYVALTGYDLIALHHMRRPMPYRQVALAAFISYAFVNNLGFALLTGGSARLKLYGRAGLSTGDIAALTLICGLTFTLSVLLVGGVGMTLHPSLMSTVTHLPAWLAFVVGVGVLTALALYVRWVGQERRAVQWKGWQLSLPGSRSTLAQFAIGVGDMICASAALYALLPTDPGLGFWVFVGVYGLATAVALISHVPGGMGVFETFMLLTLPGVPPERLIASLLIFRFIYFLLPLAVALGLLLWHDSKRRPEPTAL